MEADRSPCPGFAAAVPFPLLPSPPVFDPRSGGLLDEVSTGCGVLARYLFSHHVQDGLLSLE